MNTLKNIYKNRTQLDPNYFPAITKKKLVDLRLRTPIVYWLVVSGTIAPPRKLPDITAEDTIRIILSNLNLVVPVVAAILVIIIAIIVICILRSKGNHHKGIETNINFRLFFLPSLDILRFPDLLCLRYVGRPTL